MTRLALAVVLVAVTAGAREADKAEIALTVEHTHPSGAFTFLTPEGWKVAPMESNPLGVEATFEDILVRFFYQPGDAGYDSLHVTCMQSRLTDRMDAAPQVSYEYDFLSWEIEPYRFLDSAFIVKYDEALKGSKEWRQRNLTVVGGGHSLCAISYAPTGLYKKSAAVRAVLDAVVKSIVFK